MKLASLVNLKPLKEDQSGLWQRAKELASSHGTHQLKNKKRALEDELRDIESEHESEMGMWQSENPDKDIYDDGEALQLIQQNSDEIQQYADELHAYEKAI